MKKLVSLFLLKHEQFHLIIVVSYSCNLQISDEAVKHMVDEGLPVISTEFIKAIDAVNHKFCFVLNEVIWSCVCWHTLWVGF